MPKMAAILRVLASIIRRKTCTFTYTYHLKYLCRYTCIYTFANNSSLVRSFGRSVKSESITDPLRFVQSALHGLQRCLEPQHLETGLVEFRKQLMRLPVKIVK